MSLILDGTNGVTFPNSTVQAVAGLPTTGGNLSGSLAFTQSNAGITFANSSALTNSQLNDYEVGSYTPTITASGSNPTVGYANQFGQYTKIGRLVQFVLWLQINSISGGSGAIYISLPFALASNSIWYQSTSVWFQNMTFSNAFAQGLTNPNATTMWITTMVSSKTSGYGNVMVSDLGSTTEIRISGSYQAAF